MLFLIAIAALLLLIAAHQHSVIRDLRDDARRSDDYQTYLEEELRDARLYCRPTPEEIIRKLEQPEVCRSLIESIEKGGKW